LSNIYFKAWEYTAQGFFYKLFSESGIEFYEEFFGSSFYFCVKSWAEIQRNAPDTFKQLNSYQI
jgi:hypothetical protein